MAARGPGGHRNPATHSSRNPLADLGWVAVAVAVAVAVIVVLVVSNRTRSGQPRATVSFPSAAHPTTYVDPRTAPTPPARGAYFGAWVGPAVYTQANSIAVVDSLQRDLGRRLDIVHTYLKWQAPFPTVSDLDFARQGSTLLVSWAGTDTRAIVSGAYDKWIRKRALAIKAFGHPVFLEWRWEMDRPNLHWQIHSGAEYVAAWKHIRVIFKAEHVNNVAWVWCPTAAGFADGRAAAFYPGNSEVDWICADAYPGASGYRSFANTVGPFLTWAAQHPRPVMIGEYGVPRSYGSAGRAAWLRDATQTVRDDPQIKALIYFDADPTGHGPQLSYSLQDDAAALREFRGMADNSYFNPVHLSVQGQ